MQTFLRITIGLCLLLAPHHATAGNTPIHQIVVTEAQAQGVPARLIKAVIRAESAYNTQAISPKGAQGLMQLMPATAQRFGVSDAFNPAQNIKAGTRYLKLLKRQFGTWSLALAAYNAGEGTVQKYNGIPPYKETRNYVKKVLTEYNPSLIPLHLQQKTTTAASKTTALIAPSAAHSETVSIPAPLPDPYSSGLFFDIEG